MFETYWEKGISFDSHLNTIKQKKELSDDYKNSFERINNALENYIPPKSQEKNLTDKNFKGKILIIAESWCGDCSQSIPIINTFFKTKTPVKILYRDENPDLMQRFLTNGNKSIPIVIFFDEHNKVISHWGPRTKYGSELLSKHKNDNRNFQKELFLSELHTYYQNNKGVDIIDEIISLL